MLKYKMYHSQVSDPRVNLALEEYFLSSVEKDEVIVFFWQSENAVVVGRNQNPYQECNISRIEEDDVVLVRRLSGGGAVYHDLGNLNFAFIARHEAYDVDWNYDVMINALSALGVSAARSGRNDLTYRNRKFSGNAFITEEFSSLHHGTLLIDSDVRKVMNYLTVSHLKLETKGFDSVSSRIINLREANEAITIDAIIESVKNILTKNGFVIFSDQLPDTLVTSDFIKKYYSHEWNYGDFPAFDVSISEKYEWGMITLHLKIEDGCVADLKITTDSLEAEMFESFSRSITATTLNPVNVNEAIDACILVPTINKDIKGMFHNALFT